MKLLSQIAGLLFLFPFVVSAGPGFFLDDYEPRLAPTLPTPVAVNSPVGSATLSFAIDFNDSVASVLPTIFGNNSNFYLYGLENNPAGLAHLRASGAKNLRLPGGNVTNKWLWDGTVSWSLYENYEAGLTSEPTKPNNLTVYEQAAIIDSVGATPQPCVNIALARFIHGPDSVEQAASYAAAWVRQWNGVEGRGIKYWEVGNENYGGWSAGYIVNGDTIDGAWYGRAFQIFADSMHAADPSIKIGAVVYEGENASWTGAWNQELLPLVDGYADFLAVHQYFTWASDYNNVTVQQMVDALVAIEETKTLLESHVATYTTKSGDYYPIAMTEYNTRAGRKNSQQISAVFNSMALGEYVRHGYGLVNIWDVANGFGSEGDDHGMLTRNDPNRDNFDPNPTFYAYFLASRFFGDRLMAVVPEGASDVRVYPTLFAGGEAGVLVVNASAQNQNVELTLNNFVGNGSFLSYHLTANGPESREVMLNGQSENIYSGPLNYMDIAPFIRTYTADPVVATEAYSVNAYLFTPDQPVANTLANGLNANFYQNNSDKVKLFDSNGKELELKWTKTNGIQTPVLEGKPGIRILKYQDGSTKLLIHK